MLIIKPLALLNLEESYKSLDIMQDSYEDELTINDKEILEEFTQDVGDLRKYLKDLLELPKDSSDIIQYAQKIREDLEQEMNHLDEILA